jgi:hypothetical protein
MSSWRCLPFDRLLIPTTALLAAALVCGCGDGVGKTLPVTGKVTLANSPLTAESTVILFKPDRDKGNASSFEPAGTVDRQGNYALVTQGKKGAPPGWYKVVVTATEFRPSDAPSSRNHHPTPRSLVPASYGQAATSPVAIEVVKNPPPGAYDLKLTHE